MKNISSFSRLLEWMNRPAFYVCEGIIRCVNQSARSRMISEGSAVAPMLGEFLSDYQKFTGGSLTLSLTLGPTNCLASVERIGEGDLFVLSPDSEEEDTRALALAAQQLRIPLNQAMNSADQLMANGSSSGPDAEQSFSSINHSLYQMLRIVLNMSDAYQRTSPRMEIQDIPAVIHEVFSKCIALCQVAGVTLQFKNISQSVYALADSTLLERAVYNLISNALKHTAPGQTIDASLTRRGLRLYLTVLNPGTDHSLPVQVGSFSRFLREPGIEDSRNGLGLGMRLVQSAATAHGGTVLMEPQKDGGMKVTMSMTISQKTDTLHAPRMRIDYAGERNHALIELADLLPSRLYGPDLQ